MSKGQGQQVMEHSSFPFEFQLPCGKDILQTAEMLSIKNSIILQVLSAVYMLSPPLFTNKLNEQRR